MYKMAVTDIDGTLVNSKGKISQKTLDTIQRVMAKGVIFTVCTGRNINKAMPIAKQLGLKVPFVCIDGILIFDPVNNRPIMDMRMSKEHVKRFVELGIEHKTFIEVSDGYKYYKHIPDKSFEKFDFFNKHTLMGRAKSYMGGIRYVKNPTDLYKINSPIYQVVLAADKPKSQELAKMIRESGYQNVEVRDFIWENYLFINHSGMGKSRGIKILCEHFNILPDEVIAFGDENNDIDMLELVGMGVAMENAWDGVKAVADYVTESNDNDGVAKALEKFFLQGE